jgi:glycosyltransferase involved in cell wall biosynthesis
VKVLLVGPTPPPYHGCAVITRNLRASPLAERFALAHVDTSDRRSLANLGLLDLENVRLALVHGARFLAALLRERPAVVHVPVAQNRLGFLRDCLFLLPARLLRVATVVHLNGGYCSFFREAGPVVRRVSRVALGGAARVMVLGERLRNQLDGVVPPEKVVVVPYGVPDPQAERPADGADGGAVGDRGARGRPLRVLYLGTLNRTKGFVDLLAAAEQVVAERDDVEFVFAGDFATPYDARAAEPCRERLGDRARFVGVVDGAAKAEALTGSDLFVFPTYYEFEGQPLVILEAMAAGLPVISTARAAIPDMLEDGVNGVLVPEGDDTALADAVRRLVESPAERSAMGAAGRARYLEAFTEDRMMGKVGVVIDRVLAAAS